MKLLILCIVGGLVLGCSTTPGKAGLPFFPLTSKEATAFKKDPIRDGCGIVRAWSSPHCNFVWNE